MASPSRRRAESAPKPWKRIALIALLTVLVLGLLAFFVVKAAITSYLRSDRFRQFVSAKAGETLRAQCELAPLQFSGLNIFIDGFQARGSTEAPFASLGLDQLRAEISLRRFFEKVWQVEQVDVQRLQFDLSGPRVVLPPRPRTPASTASPGEASNRSGWLPNRVEIANAVVRDTNLTWAGGALRGTALTLTPGDGGWDIAGSGGKLEQAGVPSTDVRSLALRYRGDSLFITDAQLRQGASGTVKMTGEVKFDEKLDLQILLGGIALAPFLSEDWRVRLKGNVSGEINVRSPLPLPVRGPQYSGHLSLSEGELTALPVLDQIAVFTQTKQFRRLTLTRMGGDFSQDGGRLKVTKFVAESEGLIRIEGAFTIENSTIDGAFQVGVTLASLQWLPGSQARVFTVARDGYLWTPMRLTGPLASPAEDLSARLSAAAQGAVIQGVQGAAEQGIKTGRDAVKGVLDLLLPGGK